ncbi:TrmH family RNA methyltransferase [Haloimpatiens sp. FM7330]|uniref:TrmH family RNA methyltransferase n=1 Tax=Haloimpatiens sp. FM7330 TaxID=3298610 RepID=UPI00362D1EDB
MITSKDNSLIKEIKKLKEKKHRVKSKTFLVEGFRFVHEALKSNSNVKYVFICENVKEKWENVYKNLDLNNTKRFIVSENVLKVISNTDNPQGVVAVVANKENNLKKQNGFYILADKIQDPGNMGTIIRTAHASGAAGVIITKGTVDVYNDKTLRSTMGSIFNIPVIEDKDLSTIRKLKTEGFKLVASYLDSESEDFYDVSLKENVILAVGNEGNGISTDILQLSDIKVKIPMPGGTESLNAAVAASVMMYETLRQNINKNI